jgi:hypothetical protein
MGKHFHARLPPLDCLLNSGFADPRPQWIGGIVEVARYFGMYLSYGSAPIEFLENRHIQGVTKKATVEIRPQPDAVGFQRGERVLDFP